MLTAAGLALGLTHGLAAAPAAALATALVLLPAAVRAMPGTHGQPSPRRQRPAPGLPFVATATAITVLTALAAPVLPALACGLIAALPVVGLCTAMSLHMRADADTVATSHRSYVGGLGVRLAFLAVLAAALPVASPTHAWALAALAGAATLWTLVAPSALRRWLRFRGGPARPAGGPSTVVGALPEQAG